MQKIKILIIDDRPVRRHRIGMTFKTDPIFMIVGAVSCLNDVPADILVTPPNVLVISDEIAKRCGGDIQEANGSASAPKVSEGVYKLASNSVTSIIKFNDGTDFDVIIQQILDKARTSNRPPIGLQNRRATILTPIIAIGASTGGVEALSTVLAKFPQNCPPTLIVQHMKESFTAGFTTRMNNLCAANVQAAKDGAKIESGNIYIAPGGRQLEIVRGRRGLECRVFDGAKHCGHRPSVGILFESLAKLRGPRIGVILTGMGRDGAEGLLSIRQSGGATIAQDKSSSVVYGMPRVAYEIGAAEIQLPLRSIGDEIIRMGNRMLTIETVK